jgi:hypothetical protein
MIADDAVTNAKMDDDAVGIDELSATGTASASVFLRGDNTWAEAGDNFGSALFQVRDEQTSGTAAQSLSSGSWTKRDLNTVKTNEITGVSVSSSTMTIPAGSFWAACTANTEQVGLNKIRLQNTTDGSTLIVGMNASAGTGIGQAVLYGRFTLSGSKSIELQHYVQTTNPGGAAVSASVVEVYSDVRIWKI